MIEQWLHQSCAQSNPACNFSSNLCVALVLLLTMSHWNPYDHPPNSPQHILHGWNLRSLFPKVLPLSCLHQIAFLRSCLLKGSAVAHSVTVTCFPPDLQPQHCVICRQMFYAWSRSEVASWQLRGHFWATRQYFVVLRNVLYCFAFSFLRNVNN